MEWGEPETWRWDESLGLGRGGGGDNTTESGEGCLEQRRGGAVWTEYDDNSHGIARVTLTTSLCSHA